MLSTFKNMFETDIVSLLTPKRQLVGLDIGSSSIKLVQLRESKGRYYLQKFGMKSLEPEVIVDGTVMDEGRVVSQFVSCLRSRMSRTSRLRCPYQVTPSL